MAVAVAPEKSIKQSRTTKRLNLKFRLIKNNKDWPLEELGHLNTEAAGSAQKRFRLEL